MGITTTSGTVSVPEGVSPPTVSAAVSVHDTHSPHGAMAVSAGSIKPSDATHTNMHLPSKVRSQYTVYHGTIDFKAYKIQRINNNIYVAKTPPPFQPPSTHAKYIQTNIICTTPGLFPLIFSSFSDLLVLYTEAVIQAFLIMDNKEDTLT
jgi:hypothetical protein